MAYKGRIFKRNPGNDAFVYARYSSDAQRDVSVEQQISAARDYAQGHDIKIVSIFEDRAQTGTTMERKGLQDMLYHAKRERPAYLLTWKIDRIAREIHDYFAIDAQLLDCGVELITIAEELPTDMGMRYAVQGLYASMAHSFIIGHRKNVMRGLTDNASKCLYNGVTILGYKGQPDEKYHIDESTAPIVQRIFKEYADGKPLQKIANDLNSAGIKSSHGNDFVVNSLRHILVNRAYIGEYHWGKDDNSYIIPDGMPRLIDDDLFERVQKRLEANKRGGKGSIRKLKADPFIANFWLSGHIFCGECEKNSPEGENDEGILESLNTLQGTSGLSHTGRRYYYYSCKNHRKHKCGLKDVRKEYVEGFVNYVLDDIMSDNERRLCIANACYLYYKENEGTSDSYEGSLVNSIKDVDRRLNNILKAIENGIMNETTQEAMLRLQDDKKILEEELEKERIRKKHALQLEDVVRNLDGFVRNKTGKQAIFDMFVDRVLVFNDKIAVTFRYTDERREMPIKEIIKMIDNRRVIMDFLHIDNHFGFPEEQCPNRKETANMEACEESNFFA